MTDDPRGGRDASGDDLDVPQWVAAGARSQPAPEEPQPSRRARRGRGQPPPGNTEEPDDGYGAFLDFDGANGRDYVRLPRRPGALRRVVFSAGIVVIIVVIGLVAGGWWVLRQVDPPGPPGEAVTVVVPDGAVAQDIAQLLEDAGVVGNARLFREYLRLRGAGDRAFQAGRYAFSESSSMSEALAALERGAIPLAFEQLTLPEGLRVEEIAARLAQVPWFTADAIDLAVLGGQVRSPFQPPEVNTLEGLIFPDTYQVVEGETAADVVTRAVAQLGTVATELSLEQRAADLGYTPYQVLTIASMIEREARVPEDRAKIARVIYNRMSEGMRLDIDATTAFAANKVGPLTQADLETDSPYNTRLYPGLPPTPIAAPGRASIEAALAPEAGDWLFYVLADVDGRHYFTEDYDDFLAAVDEAHEKGLI